jgi:uncharacterized damage-inducible protein DinB
MQTFQDLIQSYLAGADLLRKSVAGMNKDQLVARPIADRWSTLECVAHLTDFEPIYVDRMKRIISHDRPLVFSADENLFATTLYYEERDVNEELEIIDTTRKQMARILQQLPPEAKDRIGVHSFRGLMTLEAMLRSVVEHIPHHIKFISEKRRALKI